MKDLYKTIRITNKMAVPFIRNGHYSKVMPSGTIHSFGLIEIKTNKMIGVCLFGKGANRNNTKINDFDVVELTRLVIEEDKPKGLASLFVSSCLRALSGPLFVISYADTDKGHIGYVYQATNWIYTGFGAQQDLIIINDKTYHKKSLWDIYGTSGIKKIKKAHPNLNISLKKTLGKHRYFYLIGSKLQKKKMRKALSKKYKFLPYPKGKTKRHQPSGKLRAKNKGFFD